MKRRNNKGFTLVELLAVITILGIISVISIVAITRLINKSKDEQKNSQQKTIEMATESYLQANRDLLPKSIGETTTIQLSSLKEANYLSEDIFDANGKSCMQKSYVVASKKSTTQYTYKAYLYCGNDIVPADKQIAVPTIEVKFYSYDDNNNELDASSVEDFLNKVASPKYKITITGGVKDEKEYAVDSYNYSISATVSGSLVEVYSSGTLTGKKAKKIIIPGDDSAGEVSGDLKDYIDITKATNVEINVVARNSEGVTYEKKTSIDSYGTSGGSANYKDNELPTCVPSKTSGQAKNENDWINKSNYSSSNNRKITVSCKDKGGSGCVRSKYTKTWPNANETSAEYSYINVEDNAKNKSNKDPNCKVRVNVDLESPVISIDAYNSKNGNQSVFKSNVVKTSKNVSSDEVKIAASQYENLVNGWMNSEKYPNGVFYKVTLTDNLSLKSYKWEVNAPNKTSVASNFSDVSVSNKDGISETKISGTSGTCNTKICVITISFENDGKRSGVLTVFDKAGNKVVYKINANLDRKKPSAPDVSYRTEGDDNKYTVGSWTGKNVISKPSIKGNDLSGFYKFECSYKKDGSSSEIKESYYNKDADAYVIKDSGKNTIKYRVVDNAGNSSSWSNADEICVDKIPPTPVPNITGYHTSVDNNNVVPSETWKNKNIITVASGSSDTLSKGVYYKVRATGSQTVGLKKASQITITNQGTTNVFYRACDAVGNCTSESKYVAKIDKTAPSLPNLTGCRNTNNNDVSSCSGLNTISSGSWISKYAVVVANGSTDPLSGLKTYKVSATGTGAKSEEEKGYINVKADGKTTVNFKACDKAGNCSSAKSFNVWIDNKAPSKPTVKGYKKTNSNDVTSSANLSVLNNNVWYDGYAYTEASGSVDATASDGSKSDGVFYRFTTSGTTSSEVNKKQKYRNVNSEGTSIVKFVACDAVENCSEAVSFTVNLDRTDPVCSYSKTSTGSTSGVGGNISCYDSLSGCKNDNRKTFSGLKSSTSYYIYDNVGRRAKCDISVSSYSCNCRTCGGGAYDCSTTRLIASGVTNYYCYVTLGGTWKQDGGYSNAGGIGNCYKKVKKTCYYSTYPCNCSRCYK